LWKDKFIVHILCFISFKFICQRVKRVASLEISLGWQILADACFSDAHIWA